MTVLPLEHIGAIKVGLLMWMRPQIQEQVDRKLGFLDVLIALREVQSNLDRLKLSADLHAELLDVISYLGFQLYHFINSAYFPYKVSPEFWKCLCWTYLGTVNEPDTLRGCFASKVSYDAKQMYKYACMCCEENKVIRLWPQLPPKQQHSIKMRLDYTDPLIVYWTSKLAIQATSNDLVIQTLKNQYSALYDTHDSMEVNMFKICVARCYHYGIEFFFNKITKHDKFRLTGDSKKSINSCKYFTINFILTNPKTEYLQTLFRFLEYPLGDHNFRIILSRINGNLYLNLLDYIIVQMRSSEPVLTVHCKIFVKCIVLAPRKLQEVLLEEGAKVDLFVLSIIAQGRIDTATFLLRNEDARKVLFQKISRRLDGTGAAPLIKIAMGGYSGMMEEFWGLLGANAEEKELLKTKWSKFEDGTLFEHEASETDAGSK